MEACLEGPSLTPRPWRLPAGRLWVGYITFLWLDLLPERGALTKPTVVGRIRSAHTCSVLRAPSAQSKSSLRGTAGGGEDGPGPWALAAESQHRGQSLGARGARGGADAAAPPPWPCGGPCSQRRAGHGLNTGFLGGKLIWGTRTWGTSEQTHRSFLF